MALSKVFKKSSIPDELPDLAIDELKKELKKEYSEKQEVKETPAEIKEETPKSEKNEEEGGVYQVSDEEISTQEEVEEEVPQEDLDGEEERHEIKEPEEEIINLERSFFNPLIEELKKENFDPGKVNAWYQKKFSEKSAVEGMKAYWEKQKNEFITETIEKEFKLRINERMRKLQKLESEWQEIFLKLIEKEEEMKKEEKNIKKIIKDFSGVVKKKGNVKKAHKSK